jgi:UDP-2,4-diacetamido-2,4,6-trideoxy-beta-L-altropyranose hydrolase
VLDKKILIRVDGGAKEGTGHAMRCLALSEAMVKQEIKPLIVSHHLPNSIRNRFTALDLMVHDLASTEPGSINDAARTSALATNNIRDMVIIDGNQFGTDYQKAIKKNNLGLLAIDDMANNEHYYADIIVNQNALNKSLYDGLTGEYTKFLCGTKFVILRQEFEKWRKFKKVLGKRIRQVLITIGGGDYEDITSHIIRSINDKGYDITAVLGSANTHNIKIPGVYVVRDTNNISALMANADIAISAGGTTIWELAFMGVPTIGIARNIQEHMLLYNSNKLGITVSSLTNWKEFHWLYYLPGLDKHYGKRKNMMEMGRKAVDGMGAERIIEAIKEYYNELAR